MRSSTRIAGRIAAWGAAGVLGLAVLSGLAEAGSTSGRPAAQPQSQSAASESAQPRRSDGASASPRSSASPRPKPSRSGDADRRKDRRGHGRPGPRLLHGETVMMGDSGPVTHVVQRGVVTAVSSTSFTVRSADGFTLTWTRDSATTVHTGPKDQPQRPLATGDDVMAKGVRRSATSVLARHVRVVPEGADENGKRSGDGERPAA